MDTLIGTTVDRKNIGLVKLLSILRQDLDIYCLISVNANSITQRGVGSSFFARIQGLVIESIALSIYKIYEKENKHDLNSIHGIFRHLSKDTRTTLDDIKLNEFIKNYGDLLTIDNPIYALESTIKRFRKKYRHELDRFATLRKKKVAHDEFGFTCKSLPCYDVMEKLFFFGVDFYGLVSKSFVGVIPHDFKSQMFVKTALLNIFRELGIEDIKTEME
jgi:hypothetical protein